MGQFPVISISLKGVNASDFSGACSSLVKIMNAETRRAFISLDSQKLSDVDKKLFEELMDRAPKAKLMMLPKTDTDDFIRNCIKTFAPTHLISLERPGKAANGHYHSMRGEVLDDMITDSALFLSEAKKSGATTISIGDGGNEMGMGTYRDVIEHFVPFGGTICTAESADITLASGVSNWWGIGIAALCSLFAEKNLLPTREEETESLRLAVAAGSVDGCTKKNEMTVDRLDLETHLGILDSVNDILKKELDICAIAQSNLHIAQRSACDPANTLGWPPSRSQSQRWPGSGSGCLISGAWFPLSAQENSLEEPPPKSRVPGAGPRPARTL